ncbi:MAG: DUF4258 domain-containing protein, partial [Tissierellia bacterium]|nr:DUF4258 domain-containing protein [Tissierellia bacterium]
DLNTNVRAARDPVTGKTIWVDANMKYKDWKEKYVDSAIKIKLDNLKGINTYEGFKVESISNHLIERVIQRNIKVEDIEEALINPLKMGKRVVDKEGLPSIRFYGEDVTVVANPDIGKLVTTYRTSSNRAAKWKREKNENS